MLLFFVRYYVSYYRYTIDNKFIQSFIIIFLLKSPDLLSQKTEPLKLGLPTKKYTKKSLVALRHSFLYLVFFLQYIHLHNHS